MNPVRPEHVENGQHSAAEARIDSGRVSLDSVLITDELSRRPFRPPDYEAENRGLVALAWEMANSPGNVLQRLAEVTMEQCKAHSAGVSLLDRENGEDVFRWMAVAGQLAVNLGGSIARNVSPCGVVLDRNSVLLFRHPELHYKYPVRIDPPIVEALLVPFHFGGKPVGTIWVIAHDQNRKFDAEDARLLQTLGKFASSAHQVLQSLEAVKAQMAEREQAEKQLRGSEQRFRALVSASSEVLYRMSPDWTEMWQMSGGAFILDSQRPRKDWLREYIPPEDQPVVLATIQRAIQTKGVFELEHRVRRVNQSIGWTFSRAVPVLDDKGEITEWFGAATDVTERKEAEEVLRESKDRLKAVIENLAEGVVVVNPNGAILDWNQMALRMHGYDKRGDEPVIFSAAVDLYELRRLDGTPVPVENWPVPRLLRGEEMQNYELAVRRKIDGWERIFSYGGKLVRDSAGNAVMGLLTIRDVTDLKKAQQALVRSEKLASVGRMASTIAHEINNPLAAAMNTLFLASATPQLPDAARANLNLADQELRRVAHIVKQTLGFYRETGIPDVVHLPEVLDGTLDLYAPKLRNKSICVERRYRGPAPVYGIEGELRQVISNLVANSIDALGNAGVLHVRVTPWKAKPSMVRLTIADNGVGIKPEDLKHIFEPFFTTKPSFGTGLGLWVTKELVNKHAGRVRVRSRIGKGTVFSIWFPTERRRSRRDRSSFR